MHFAGVKLPFGLIKFVSDSIIDVFVGEGWSGWSRFEVQRVGGKLQLKLIKGKPMDKAHFKQLFTEINRT